MLLAYLAGRHTAESTVCRLKKVTYGKRNCGSWNKSFLCIGIVHSAQSVNLSSVAGCMQHSCTSAGVVSQSSQNRGRIGTECR